MSTREKYLPIEFHKNLVFFFVYKMTKKSHTLLSLVGLIVVLTGIEAVGQTLITKHAERPNMWYFVLASLIYGLVVPWMLWYSLQYEGVATVNLMWNVLTIIVMTTIGYVLFKEQVNHLHLISILFAIAAIVMLYWANTHKKE